jgi:hypothetical protein
MSKDPSESVTEFWIKQIRDDARKEAARRCAEIVLAYKFDCYEAPPVREVLHDLATAIKGEFGL